MTGSDGAQRTTREETRVTEPDKLRIPTSMRRCAEPIIAVSDEVCEEHLDAEYAELARRLVAKLARKRPSPLTRGDPRIWAAGVLYALAQINFLFDKSQSPHLSADQLSVATKVKKTTMANKAKLVRDMVGLSHVDAELTRRAVADMNPLTWMIEVDGLLVDVRILKPEIQLLAYERGLIPYPPGQADGDG